MTRVESYNAIKKVECSFLVSLIKWRQMTNPAAAEYFQGVRVIAVRNFFWIKMLHIMQWRREPNYWCQDFKMWRVSLYTVNWRMQQKFFSQSDSESCWWEEVGGLGTWSPNLFHCQVRRGWSKRNAIIKYWCLLGTCLKAPGHCSPRLQLNWYAHCSLLILSLLIIRSSLTHIFPSC